MWRNIVHFEALILRSYKKEVFCTPLQLSLPFVDGREGDWLCFHNSQETQDCLAGISHGILELLWFSLESFFAVCSNLKFQNQASLLDQRCTQKCRFMGKEVREISCFLVVPQRAFPLSVWRGFTDFLTQKYLHHSTACCRASQNLVPPRTNMRRAINLVYDISEGLALKLGF